MKIAIAQVDMIFEDKKSNYVMIEDFVNQAHDNHAEMIIFPEMTCTGFSMNCQSIGEEHHETEIFMKELSKNYHIIIVFGQVLKQDEHYVNNLMIVEGGQVKLSYNKLHPFTYEAQYYQKGDKIVQTTINDFTVTPFICYDLRFPEIFQYASKTSDIIIVIASWPKQRDDHWLTLLKARAIENQCYVIGVNRVGHDEDNEYIGHSQVFDSFGQALTRLSSEEEIIYCQIEKDDILKSRQGTDFKRDRRDDFYASLYDDKKILE